MINVISTSKLDQSIKKRAKVNGIKIYDYDFVKITYLFNKDLIEKINGNTYPFLFTSKNAIEALENLKNTGRINLQTNKAYAINGVTSELALKSGFEILGTGKNSFSLVKKIYEQKEKGIFHLTSAIRRDEIYSFLDSTGIIITPCEIYRKKLTYKMIFRKYDAVLFFSPSQIDSFIKYSKILEKAIIYCIGETTKEYFKKFNLPNKIIVAKESRKESMLIELADYYKNCDKQSIFKEFISYFRK